MLYFDLGAWGCRLQWCCRKVSADYWWYLVWVLTHFPSICPAVSPRGQLGNTLEAYPSVSPRHLSLLRHVGPQSPEGDQEDLRRQQHVWGHQSSKRIPPKSRLREPGGEGSFCDPQIPRAFGKFRPETLNPKRSQLWFGAWISEHLLPVSPPSDPKATSFKSLFRFQGLGFWV